MRALLIVVPALATLAACGGAPSPAGAGVAQLSALAAQDQQTTNGDTAGPTAPLIDPCRALTKADVQPFFTAQIATALPALLNSATERSCEWAPTNKTSSLIVDYLVGDGAQTKVMLNREPGGGAVSVPGIGDGANHLPHDPSMLFSYKGSGSSTVVCTVTTTGRQFSLVPDPSVTLSDDQATRIDEQYGTLCNKLYGSGNTTPTVPTMSVSAAAPPPSLTGPVPADSGATMPGTAIPLPAGVDCSGDRTAKDSLLGLACTQPITDPLAIYTFYLTALPAHGFTINSQQFWPEKDGAPAHGALMFTGGTDGLCFISIVNGKITISKQES